MAKKLPIDWNDLELAFERGSYETVFYLDRETGRVVLVSEHDAPWGEDWDDLPEWQREALEVRRAVEEDPDRYLAIPGQDSREGWRDMAAFIDTVPDDRLAERLSRAIRGRGAFRSFKDVLLDHPRERERWFAFEARRVHERLLDWLEVEGIEPEEVPDPPKPEV